MLWSSFFVTLVAKKIVLINLCCRPCFIWGSITIITVWTNMIIINVCKFFYLLIECFLWSCSFGPFAASTELPNITNAIKNAKQNAIIFFHRFIAVPPLSIDTLFFDNYIIQNSTLYFLILSSQSLPKRKSYFMGFLSAAFTI